MAKGQQRGNREAKKPKQVKRVVHPPGASVGASAGAAPAQKSLNFGPSRKK
jgi:hypothetical protein